MSGNCQNTQFVKMNPSSSQNLINGFRMVVLVRLKMSDLEWLGKMRRVRWKPEQIDLVLLCKGYQVSLSTITGNKSSSLVKSSLAFRNCNESYRFRPVRLVQNHHTTRRPFTDMSSQLVLGTAVQKPETCWHFEPTRVLILMVTPPKQQHPHSHKKPRNLFSLPSMDHRLKFGIHDPWKIRCELEVFCRSR